MGGTDVTRRGLIAGIGAIAATGIAKNAAAKPAQSVPPGIYLPRKPETAATGPLIVSEPALQNAAATSIGVVFAVSADASGWVEYSKNPDMSGAVRAYSGEAGLMDVNGSVAQVRLRGLSPATRYYYRIGADRISYGGGYNMKNLGSEAKTAVHSFVTLGREASGSFCVINDTHESAPALDAVFSKMAELDPRVAIWNGDASNTSETIEAALKVFIRPHPAHPSFSSDLPFMFLRGNHDYRGRFNRNLERVVMLREPSERAPEFAALGRNFVQRLGDVALIGLDTGEDKLDTNPIFAGIFRMKEYRELQTKWLAAAVESDDVKSAKFKIVFCHIPLFDPRPDANPGDIAPADKAPAYRTDYAIWQRTCRDLWAPYFEKCGVQAVIAAHQHSFRIDEPAPGRPWRQIIGGGPHMKERGFPTVIEGRREGAKLVLRVHDVFRKRIAATVSIG